LISFSWGLRFHQKRFLPFGRSFLSSSTWQSIYEGR
jgi:hypothetical protein